jgi:hypothetical protein
MRKLIKFPAPELSQLKEVNIDLDMNGRHYALLATCEGQVPEDVVLSILKDLVEEDANKLTLSELRYLFMLVKINSMEGNYYLNIECTHRNKKGEICGHDNKFQGVLADADLNPTPSGYKVPTITFVIGDTEKEYKIMPPTMDMESKLYNYFQTEKNAEPEQIAKDKKLSFEYTFIRAMMHLVDEHDNRVVTVDTKFDDLFEHLETNKYQRITDLYNKVIEVNKFGVQNKIYTIKCEECGGTLVFQIPLLAGLLD